MIREEDIYYFSTLQKETISCTAPSLASSNFPLQEEEPSLNSTALSIKSRVSLLAVRASRRFFSLLHFS